MLINFLKTTEDILIFEIINNDRIFNFKFCIYSSNINDISEVPYPSRIRKQAERVVIRYLNWLLITDGLRASLNGFNIHVSKNNPDILKHWGFDIYGNIQPLVEQLNIKINS